MSQHAADEPSEEEALARVALGTAESVHAASRYVKFPALRSALSTAWASSPPFAGSYALATACSIAALAATEATDDDLKHARAAASVLTLTMPRGDYGDDSSAVFLCIADVLAVALNPPPESVERPLDVKCASILARSFNLRAHSDGFCSVSLRAAALALLADKLFRDRDDMDNSDVGACLALASQLQLFDQIPAASLVDVAVRRGMWETAEDLVDAARLAKETQGGESCPVEFTTAAIVLVSAALEASRYRQGDLCARRFGISAQFPDASLLHARDTVSTFLDRVIELW
jgi:hypothetical protein